jgi:hypothetical protein
MRALALAPFAILIAPYDPVLCPTLPRTLRSLLGLYHGVMLPRNGSTAKGGCMFDHKPMCHSALTCKTMQPNDAS